MVDKAPETPKMQYRHLGETGLKVSVISYGNWLNSNDPKVEERTVQLIKKAWDLGINFFDTAEVYGYGQAEIQMGKALKALGVKREDLVVSTKIFWGTEDVRPNTRGLSRKHIKEGVKQSLERLGLDYVDVVFCHRFDTTTPVEETVRAFDDLIKEGKIHYWGTSEWTAANIFEVREVCEKYNLIKPSVEQPQYNMMVREKFELDFARLFSLYKMGSTVWSPLAGGILTGKYNDGNVPQDSRFDTFKENKMMQSIWNRYFAPEKKDKLVKILTGLADIAKELGCTQAQLAMGWVIANRDVSTAITSATRPEQLEDIVQALNVYPKIDAKITERIDELLENAPDQGFDFRNSQQRPKRR